MGLNDGAEAGTFDCFLLDQQLHQSVHQIAAGLEQSHSIGGGMALVGIRSARL